MGTVVIICIVSRMNVFLSILTRPVDSFGGQEMLGLQAGWKQKLTKPSTEETRVVSLNPPKVSLRT